jgi:branched-chain amino acid transport system substrate-binding protein
MREEGMNMQFRRVALAMTVAFAGTLAAWSACAADPPKSVRIGYVISLSGPNAQGAAITTLSGYKLWVDDVNKRGGLKVQGFDKPIPIEVTEYDDTSNAENAVRLVERLMTQDKVDFVLPPWNTGFNLATAPVFARNGYPHLAVTANSNDAAALTKQMPTLFFFLNEPRNFGAALGEVLSKLKNENKINNKIVMLSIADQFGAEFTSGVTPVLQQAGFEFALR